ncbi:MAG: ferritin-like domain-containing protein [Armatimonadetes bacterium]|nr:ferritin-like domain-containing protein [Armatimonadota bacterium]
MKLDTLKDLFVEELQDLYSAEQQIIEALPKMAESASNPQLKTAFEEHLKMTQEQKSRLEKIAQQLGVDPSGKHCKGMEGLIKEGQELMKEDADPAVLDAGLITAAQRVEHYEIAGYGTARTYASTLGHAEVCRLLQTTLEEEGETDHRLTRIAEQVVNPKAMSA